MKELWQSLKSLYGVISFLMLIIGAFGAFGMSFVVPSAPPWASAIVFAAAFVIGFLCGSFGAGKRSDLEAKKADIAAKTEVEKAKVDAKTEIEKAKIAARAEVESALEKAYATERARIETEAAEKRRAMAIAAEAKRRSEEQRASDMFRLSIKSMEFSAKVLLWRIYATGELSTEEGSCPSELEDVMSELEAEGYIEQETVDFGVSAYRICDDKRRLIDENEDLFENAKAKTEDGLLDFLE